MRHSGNYYIDHFHRRRTAESDACTGIPTEALEAGVVGKMVETLTAIRDADQTDMALDPEWPARQARALLSQIKGGDHG